MLDVEGFERLESNDQLVERAADLAERLGRSVAMPEEARRILGISVAQ